jgi:hypothetical protein
MEPIRLFPIIVLLSLVTVEYRGRALLGFPGPGAAAVPGGQAEPEVAG